MSDRLAKVLDVLDVGLQSSTEASYGTDHAPGRCVRCQRHEPAEGGELCSGCRAFLLGDVDDDPTRNEASRKAVTVLVSLGQLDRELTPEEARTALEQWGIAREAIAELVQALVDAFGPLLERIVDAVGHLFSPPLSERQELRGIEVPPIDSPPAPPLRWRARHTLAMPVLRRPPVDLRATEAPRRPPSTTRRRT